MRQREGASHTSRAARSEGIDHCRSLQTSNRRNLGPISPRWPAQRSHRTGPTLATMHAPRKPNGLGAAHEDMAG